METRIVRIGPATCGTRGAWQVEIDDTCVCVRASRGEALDVAHRVLSAFELSGVPCEAVISTDVRPVRIAA